MLIPSFQKYYPRRLLWDGLLWNKHHHQKPISLAPGLRNGIWKCLTKHWSNEVPWLSSCSVVCFSMVVDRPLYLGSLLRREQSFVHKLPATASSPTSASADFTFLLRIFDTFLLLFFFPLKYSTKVTRTLHHVWCLAHVMHSWPIRTGITWHNLHSHRSIVSSASGDDQDEK